VQRVNSKIGGEIQQLKRYDQKNRGRQAKGNQDCMKRSMKQNERIANDTIKERIGKKMPWSQKFLILRCNSTRLRL
jgi:hypothetical protein